MTIEEMQHKLLSLVDDKVQLQKELAIYREALKLSCENLANNYCTEYCLQKYYECTLGGVRNKECFNHMINNHIEEFLQKVRETQ